MRIKIRNLVLVGSIFTIITLVTFFSLVLYDTSVKVELWDVYFEYRASEPNHRYSVTVTISVGNPNFFPVTIRNMSASLTANGVYMLGSKPPEELYVIPAFGWRQWTQTFYSFGDYADFLLSSEPHKVVLDLKGRAFCSFYETLFQVTIEKNSLLRGTGLG